MQEAPIDTTPVIVTKEVLENLTAIRDSGAVNMFNYEGILEYAGALGYEQAYLWLLENKALYAKGLFCGFITDPSQDCVLN